MKRRILAATAMTMIGATPAMAQDWRMLRFNGVDDREVAVYYDAAATTKPSATTRTITITNAFRQEQSFSSGKRYWAIRSVYALDCATMSANSTATDALDANGNSVVTSTTPGKTTSMAPGSPYSMASKAICAGDAQLPGGRAEGTPLQDAPSRFSDRAMVRTALTSTGWFRITTGGTVGKRLSIFVNQSSITTDARGRKVIATMVIEEEPNGVDDPKRYHYATLLDCAAYTGVHRYAQVYSPGGDLVGSLVPSGPPFSLPPGTLAGAYRRICTGDWSMGRPFPMLPQAVVAGAFAM
jgi:hypothetical protein